MAIFNRSTGGLFADVIRCDEPSYLIWKWHPKGTQPGNNNRENSIRYGSSLRVKDGELAVFVYKQKNGVLQDFIEGPYDYQITTENFPVLATIIGWAYQGGSPFQAEVYFINMARVIQIPFGVPYFDVYDPRFTDIGVPTAVRGRITFKISDYMEFIKLHRLATFDLQQFQVQIRDAVAMYVKQVVANLPKQQNISVLQIEQQIDVVHEKVEKALQERCARDFGVEIRAIDVSAIEIKKESDGFRRLQSVTSDLIIQTERAKAETQIKNLRDRQRINVTDEEDRLRIQREEAQYAKRKQTQQANFAAYQLEQQAAVGVAGAEALRNQSGGGGFNPAGMVAGMSIGASVGQSIAGTVNSMMGGTPSTGAFVGAMMPTIPDISYYVAFGKQPKGPFDYSTLEKMKTEGTFNENSLVWKKGMAGWVKAETVRELEMLFIEIPEIPDFEEDMIPEIPED